MHITSFSWYRHLVLLEHHTLDFFGLYQDSVNAFRERPRGSCQLTCLSYQHHYSAPTVTRLHELDVLFRSGPLLLHLLAIGPE